MKLKIEYLHFQRNGVQGEPFYHCLVEMNDDKKRTMLITFQASVNDTQVLWSSCRAVDIEDMTESWRGDVIAARLNDILDKMMIEKGGTIYDCCNKSELYTI